MWLRGWRPRKSALREGRAFESGGGNLSGLRLFLPIRKPFPLPVVGQQVWQGEN
jgi:hypothetical protein